MNKRCGCPLCSEATNRQPQRRLIGAVARCSFSEPNGEWRIAERNGAKLRSVKSSRLRIVQSLNGDDGERQTGHGGSALTSLQNAPTKNFKKNFKKKFKITPACVNLRIKTYLFIYVSLDSMESSLKKVKARLDKLTREVLASGSLSIEDKEVITKELKMLRELLQTWKAYNLLNGDLDEVPQNTVVGDTAEEWD